MAQDKIKSLYDTFVKEGYKMESEADFRKNLADPAKRKAAYDALVKEGYNMEAYGDFETNIGFGATAQQHQQTAAPTTEATPTTEQTQSEPAQPAWQPTEQEKIAMSYQLHQTMDDFNRRSKEMLDQTRIVVERHTPEGREKLKAAKFQAQLAGTPTKVMGLTPPTPPASSEGEQSEDGKQSAAVRSQQSPVPYGVKIVEGKRVTEWLLPDGRLTTNLMEADQAEYVARNARLEHQFVSRMKQNGLNVANQDDVAIQTAIDAVTSGNAAGRVDAEAYQQVLDYMGAMGLNPKNSTHAKWAVTGDERSVLEYQLRKTEARVKKLNAEKAQWLNDHPGHYTNGSYMGGPGMVNRTYQGGTYVSGTPYPNSAELQRETDLMVAQEAALRKYDQANRAKGKGWFGKVTQGLLDGITDPNTWTMGVYDMSGAEGLRNKGIASLGAIRLRQVTPDAGGWYNGGRFAGEMVGDPITYASLGVGSAAGNMTRKAAIGVATRTTMKGIEKQVAERLLTRQLGYRMLQGSMNMGANLATFEGMRDAHQQMMDGGWYDDEGNFHEGFSLNHSLKQGGHGFILGSVMGGFGVGWGNVGNWATKQVSSVGGKAAVRSGQYLGGAVFEGTIFAAEDIYNFHTMDDDKFDRLYAQRFGYDKETDPAKRNAAREEARSSMAWNAWSESQAMIFGMKMSGKATHPMHTIRDVKSVLTELRGKDTREHRSFSERLKANLDRSPLDINLTKEEVEELRSKGYGKLADFYRMDEAPTLEDGTKAEFGRIQYGEMQTGPNDGRILGERESEVTGFERTTFDGYSALEQLMQDGKVSQNTRAKAYYLLTGNMLPVATVSGCSVMRGADGSITVNATTHDGEVITTRKFTSEAKAEAYKDAVMRQAELNTIDVGEQFREAEADKKIFEAAVQDAYPGADLRTVEDIYNRIKNGDKSVTDAMREQAAKIDEAMERNANAGDEYRPEAMRNEIKEETGIDVDEVLKKQDKERTPEEKVALQTYAERLFPEEARQKAQAEAEAYAQSQPTPEQSEALTIYNASGETYSRFDEGTPEEQAEARADMDAIDLRYKEALELIDDAFGAEAEMRFAEVQENPWDLVTNPELTADQQDAVLYYINARAALDGVQDAANESADRKRDAVIKGVQDRTHVDAGVVIPATMKVDDRQVFIVKGNVVMFEDGTAVDVRNSDESVIIFDPAKGEREFTSPDRIFKVGEAVDPQAEIDNALAEVEAQRNIFSNENPLGGTKGDEILPEDEELLNLRTVNEAENAVSERLSQGNDRAQDGETSALARAVHAIDSRGEEAMVYSGGSGSESALGGGESTLSRIEDRQRKAEQYAKEHGMWLPMQDVYELGSPGPSGNEADTYISDNKIYKVNNLMNSNGDIVSLLNKIALHNDVFPETAYNLVGFTGFDGRSVYPILSQRYIGDTRNAKLEEIDEYMTSLGFERKDEHTYTNPQYEISDLRPRNVLVDSDGDVYVVDAEIRHKETALSKIPLHPQTQEPMFEAVDKDTAWDGLVEAVGSDKDALEIGMAQIEQASADLEALKKKPPTPKTPKLKGSPMAMAQAKRDANEAHQKAMEEYHQKIAEAEARHKAWSGIVGVYTSRSAELRRQQDEEMRRRQAEDHDAAVARFEEKQRIKAEKQAEAERLGSHNAHPRIKARWDAAPKVEGNSDAITLPDGSTIRGRYVLTEAGAASASHDVNNAYAPTEGFPIDENGQSVNDRDYERDKDAQRIVEQMAGAFDNRALQSPIIVSRDGIVLSGNNRTMSGDLAARQGTDKAYVDYVREFGGKYGFTPEQMQGMKNPRLVFVPDETLPYDATTFSRFNAQEMKSQSKPEAAVKLGKIVPDDVFNSIVGDIARYDRLSDYYGDEKAVAHALGALMQAGVINDKQMPEMRTGTALSAAGKELIENTLIGKVFQTSTDAVRQIISMPTLRQSIVMGLNEIAGNRTLAKSGYDLSKELGDAVDLVYRAKSAMPDVYTDGMPVSPFGRMQGLFDDEFGDSRVTDGVTLLLADLLNSGKPSDIRKVLTSYNNEASSSAEGQIDMFSGTMPTKEEILTTINDHFKNATPKEQQALVDAAIAERKRRAEAEAEQRGRDEESEQVADAVQRDAEPQQLTAGAEPDLTPEEQAIAARVEVSEDDWTEGDGNRPTYKRTIIIDGKHKAVQVDEPDADGHYTGTYFEYDGKRFGDIAEIVNHIDAPAAEPSEAQKKAGNYKMKHVRIDGYDISIENEKGSIRRGKDADGKEWKSEMHNDYGYIRGTEGVDGDHIDVFLSDTPEQGDVFVVDQYNPDGSFDEHKVMYGFADGNAAREAYLSNYDKGWETRRRIDVTGVSKDEFKKWIGSSRRKTKPFADYEFIRDKVSASSQGSVAEYKSVRPMESKSNNLFDYFTGSLHELIGKAKESATGLIKKIIAPISERLRSDLSAEGIEIDEGYKHVIDNNAIRHTLKNHGGKSEEKRGQIPITDEDFSRLEDVVTNYDNISVEKGKRGNDNIIYSKTYEDGTTIFVEENRIGRKELAAVTMWKKKNPTRTDANHTEATQISDLSGISEGKDNTLSADKQTSAPESSASYAITPATYTNKKGKETPMHRLEFGRELTKEEESAVKKFASEKQGAGRFAPARGWKDRENGGWLFRTEEDARKAGELISNEEAVADAQPLSREDITNEVKGQSDDVKGKPKKTPVNRVSIEDLAESLHKNGEAKLSDHAEPIEPKPEVRITDEMEDIAKQMRDILGVDDSEVGGVHFRDPDELKPEQKRKLVMLGIDLTMRLFDQGKTDFPTVAKVMVGMVGEKIKPWIKAMYKNATIVPGYEDMPFTSDAEIDRFDIANFDKPSADVMKQAEMIVAERKAKEATSQAEKEVIETRNQKRKEHDKQTEADTAALADKGEAVASKAESVAKSADPEKELAEAYKKVDETLDEVNNQLAVLGYYDEPRAETKAAHDAGLLANRLVEDLGIDIDGLPKGAEIVKANIAGPWGYVDITLPMPGYAPVTIGLEMKRHGRALGVDYIHLTGVDSNSPMAYIVGENTTVLPGTTTYADLLTAIRGKFNDRLPKPEAPKPKDIFEEAAQVAEHAKARREAKKSPKKSVSSQKKQPEVKPEQPIGDLFSGLFDEPNENERQGNTTRGGQAVAEGERSHTVGTDGHRTDGGLRAGETRENDSRGKSDAVRSEKERGIDGDAPATGELGGVQPSERNRGRDARQSYREISVSADERGRASGGGIQRKDSDGGGKRLSEGEPTTVLGKGGRPSTVKKQERRFTKNFRYDDEGNEADNYTPSQRLEGNVAALETLADVLFGNGKPTDEQKAIMSRFRGWGQVDLSKYWNVDALTERSPYGSPLKRLGAVIKRLDPDGEKKLYEAVKRASLSAYFTPTPVARAQNTFLTLAGFRGGKLLDPSMGNGVFEGTLPKDLQERTMITGVELDWLTGQLARALYPDADVRITGFQNSGFASNTFDVVTSNVPFGDFGVNDPSWKYDKSPIKRSSQNRIHNYYAVKMLELARPGGLVSMMTTSAVMDTPSNQYVRRHIAEQGEIIGAIRIPDNTFQGTGAVADIIFVRKWRDENDMAETRSNPDYQNIEKAFLDTTEMSVTSKYGDKTKVKTNGYYGLFPKNMIGEAVAGNQYRADAFGLTSKLTYDEIGREVEKAVKRIVGTRNGEMFNPTKTTREVHEAVREAYKGDGDWVSNGNLVVQDGKIGTLQTSTNEYGEVTRTFIESPQHSKLKEKIEDMGEVRKAMKMLVTAQINGADEKNIAILRKQLNTAYNNFVSKHGKLRDKNNSFILDDIDGYTLRALEVWKEGKFVGLSDIFTKSTIKPALKLYDAKTPQEAITSSLAEFGELRPAYMEEILGDNWAEACGDMIFRNPDSEDGYVTSDEYLSGDVVSKLEKAEKAAKIDPTMERNVTALREVQPIAIPFAEISIHLGARWIPGEVYWHFVRETYGLHVSSSHRRRWVDGQMVEELKSGISYSPDTDTFHIEFDAKELGGEAESWSTARKSAKEILQAALEDKTLVVYDTDKEGNKILNSEQTELANEKISELRERFETWLGENEKRAEMLAALYNRMFNSTVKRKFDGSHLNVPGLMGKELRPHQKDAVWMLINNRGGIVDHIVGAGKTLVMQSAIMEMRRMGIAKKPMIVALKSTVPQIARDFKEAFPSARVLAPDDGDFSKENRKRFMANISLNDYDCVILSHEQYCMLPHSEEAERVVIDEQLAQLNAMIEYLYGTDDKSQMTKRQIKSLEKRKENLLAKLAKRLGRNVDREFCFENLGVDYLFVDECHQFKSLPYVTSYNRVAGLGDTKGSNRAVALLTGIRYLQKMHQGDKGTIFLSGTTITNSLVEIYNLLNYLRPRKMAELGFTTFDAWASTFAVHSAELEAGVTGEFRMKDRFRSFVNLPELSQLYAEIADVRNDSNLKLPKPSVDGKYDIVPERQAISEINREIVSMLNSHDGSYFGLKPKDERTFPWSLRASTLSANASISPRLIFPDMEDEGGKIHHVCDNVKKAYDEMAEHKGVQLIFCEAGVPGKGKEYDAYNDIINRLTKTYGIPRNEIAYIQQAKNDDAKEELFQKAREGQIRILIGGTKNMGTGVNVQTRITDMHFMSVPWTPAALEQCIGRGARQGNMVAKEVMGDKVRVHYYAAEGSLDLYKFQLLDAKGKMFTQFKTGTTSGSRNFDEGAADEDGNIDPAELVAILSGNPIIFEKAKQEKYVKKLKNLRNGFLSDYQRKKAKFDELTSRKEKFERLIRINNEDVADLQREGFVPDDKGVYPSKVTVSDGNYFGRGMTFDKPKEAGEYILKLLKDGKKVYLQGFGKRAEIVSVNEEKAGLFAQHYEVQTDGGYNTIRYSVRLSGDATAAGTAFRSLLQRIINNQTVYANEYDGIVNQLNGMTVGDGVFPRQAELDVAVATLKQMTTEYNALGKNETGNNSGIPVAKTLSVHDAATLIEKGEFLKVGYESTIGLSRFDGALVLNIPKKQAHSSLYDDIDLLDLGHRSYYKPNNNYTFTFNNSDIENIVKLLDSKGFLISHLSQANGDKTKFRDGGSEGDRLLAIRALEPIEVNSNELGRKELFSIYRELPSVEKDGHEIKFLRTAFGKNYKEGGLFAQAVPVLDEVLEQSVLAYSENDSYGGLIRPDGTEHKAHPNVIYFDNYVGKIRLDGQDYYVRLTVQNTKDSTTGVHSCFVSNVELYKNPTSTGTGTAIFDRPNLTQSGILDAKLQQFFERASSELLPHDMRGRALELSTNLNTPIKVVDKAEDAIGNPSNRHRRAKGWINTNGEIVVVLSNHSDVADIENTVVHEIVGHSGLEAMIGPEGMDEFVTEVYDHAGQGIKKKIDARADKEYSDDIDRMTRQKGGGVFAKAEATVEAGEKRRSGHYQREATKEYMADMAGEIGDKGFERMSQEEQTLWGKIKAKVQQFLDKFLRGLKIAKSIRLTDKDLAYILYKTWKHKRENGVFAKAEDIVMRRKTGWDKMMFADVGNKKTGISEAGLNPIYPSEAGTAKGNEARLNAITDPATNHTAKVMEKLEIAKAGLYQVAETYRNKTNPRGFLSDLSRSLDLIVGSNGSGYRSFELVDGRTMTIRVSNHNANSERAKEDMVSIVIKRKHTPNVFVSSDNHVDEYVYFKEDIRKAPAGTLSSIAESISELLDTGEYTDRTGLARENHSPESGEVHFRDGDDIVAKRPVMARAMYEKRVASSTFQAREAMQDSMLGLLEAYRAIDNASGNKRYIEDVPDYQNAYLAENAMSSRNQAEQTAYEKLIIKPMLDEVVKLAPDERSYSNLLQYMMAKHGLERNALMRDRAKADGMDPDKADATDFAGLTGLFMTGDVADAESQATQLVNDYEAANATTPLWDKVNAATIATLSKLKEGGLLSKESHDKIAAMYDNYIPLRGWSETTADELYGYMTRNDSSLRGSVMKTANGRTSIADDPIATIMMMGQQAIAQANRNQMKQAFLNYVLKNPSDLVSVNQLWLQKNDVTDEWEPVFASNINEGDDPATVQQKISDFEETMKRLSAADPDKYKSGRQARGIPYKIGTGVVGEHTVLVKRGDYTYVLTINGNPRAAQALNGLTNPDVGTGVGAALFGLGEKINHIISPIYTTRNPDFMVGNFMRDAFYGNTMTWIKESPRYAGRLNWNFIRVNPGRMARLISRYNANTLDMSNPLERQFHEFIMNGGETGYTNQADIEKQKKQVKKMLKRLRSKFSFGRIMDCIGAKWDVLNSSAENSMRFAVYLTSRQEGRTIQRSIYDAKEVSVNFNKKGAGAKFMGATGQTAVGNTAAFVSGTGRGLYVFWNATVQAATNFFRNAKRHPYKMTSAMVSMFLMGAMQAIMGAFDDDDEETNDKNRYFDQPDYVRRSNLLFRVGDQYLAHPLPHEYMSVFGMGEMAATLLMGKDEMSAGEIALNIATIMSEYTPLSIDRAGWDHALVPSAIKPLYEASINESWTGMPIYNSNPFNTDMPEWTKAYSSTNHTLVNLSETLNEWSGGDKYTKGGIDFNPAQVEYMLSGYLGGYFKIADRMMKMYETTSGEREFEWRNMPLANRVVKQGDERTANRRITNDYFEYMTEYDRLNKRIRNYEREAENNVLEYAEKLAELTRTPEYRRYWIIKGVKSELDKIGRALKEAETEEEISDLTKERDALREQIVKKIRRTIPVEETDTAGIGDQYDYYRSMVTQ